MAEIRRFFTLLVLLLIAKTSLLIAKHTDGDSIFSRKTFDHFSNAYTRNPRIVLIHSRTREKRAADFSSVENAGEIDVILEENNKTVHFHLLPNNDLISPHYKVIVRGANGTIVEELKGPKVGSCLFIGSQKGKPEFSAALSNCDGDGFTGVFVDDSGTHFIRPLKNNSDSRVKRSFVEGVTPDGLHIVTTRWKGSKCALKDMRAMTAPRMARALTPEEIQYDEKFSRLRYSSTNKEDVEVYSTHKENFLQSMKESVKDDVERVAVGSEHHISKRRIFDQYRIETAVFVDDVMYNSFRNILGSKGLITFLEDYVLTIMNAVYLLYKAPSMKTDITISVVRLEIMKEPIAKLGKADGHIKSYLNNFCGWQARLKKSFVNRDYADGRDHGLLLTGLDLWDSPKDLAVVGLAWVAGMCRPYFSCTINEGSTFGAVYVITHEMGHNLNMSHDGSEKFDNFCDENKHIMSSSTGTGKVTWSGCSNRELERFLQFERNSLRCLVDVSNPSRKVDLDKKLPGEIYNADEQCKFGVGQKAKPYIKRKIPFNNICKMLWCQMGTSATQAHPALEGTLCDRGKGRCTSGECIKDIRTGIQHSNDKENEIPDEGRSRGGVKNTFKNLLVNIKGFFKRYLFLRKGPSEQLSMASRVAKWTLVSVTDCSTSCGGGLQEGQVVCISQEGGGLVDDIHCDENRRPPRRTTCNTLPCLL